MHVRVAPRMEASVLLSSIHVHIERKHWRLVKGAQTRLDRPWRASGVKTWALVMGAHAYSCLA